MYSTNVLVCFSKPWYHLLKKNLHHCWHFFFPDLLPISCLTLPSLSLFSNSLTVCRDKFPPPLNLYLTSLPTQDLQLNSFRKLWNIIYKWHLILPFLFLNIFLKKLHFSDAERKFNAHPHDVSENTESNKVTFINISKGYLVLSCLPFKQIR